MSSLLPAVSGLFSKGAASYAKFRPEYPAELYRIILQTASLPSRDLAVDVATGSGQAAKDLSIYFDHVVALDHDNEQLRHAADIPKVSFQQGAAENTGLPHGTADLVAVAQALHWFHLTSFYPEARRILKPRGTLAIWGYDVVQFPKHDAANALLRELYSGTLGPYWSKQRRHIDNHYKGRWPHSRVYSFAATCD